MYAVFIEASSAIRRVLPSPALRFRGASVCVEAGGDGSWSPGPKQTQELGHLNLELAQPVGPSGAKTAGSAAGSHSPIARSASPSREPPNEASASPRKRTAAAGQWEDGLARGGGPGPEAPPPGPQGWGGARLASGGPGRAGRRGARGGAGRSGEGAASGRRARAARAGGSRRGARPPARAPGGGHCAAVLSAVRARGAHPAIAALARPACPGPTCGGRRGRGAPSAAEPHEQ